MEANKSKFSSGISFDDVLLKPGYSDFVREEIDVSTKLTKKIALKIPFVSAPMDTVTNGVFALSLAKLGGIGIIHRNFKIEDQLSEIKKVKSAGFMVGAATGVRDGYKERLSAIKEAGADVVCFDSAHGFTSQMTDAIKYSKRNFPELAVIAGNIATYEGAKALIEAGADALRVGMGPGAICTTRIVSGMGVPQLTAILETSRAAKPHGIPVIADGGIRYSGDMIKALAAGASSIMMGSLFASCLESAGEIVSLTAPQVPARFKSILNKKIETYDFKRYRGMGSPGAMKEGARISSEDEFHGKSFTDKVLVAEGVDSLVPLKGRLNDICGQMLGGMRSGMYYTGARTILDLQSSANFILITPASLQESHPHDVLIVDSGEKYS